MIIDVPNSGVALAVSQIASTQEQGVHRLRRRDLGSHRREVQRQHRALDLRHLDARQRHRQGDRQDRRRHLVLPHRRTTPSATRSSATPRRWSRRTAARCSARSATRSTPRTSRRSCCRRRRRRPRSSASPMPAATPSTRSSRRPSSASSRAGRTSPASWCSPATSTRSACSTAQGLIFTETWYWDLNDANRAWTKRWQAERNAAGKVPTMIQAGVYAGTLHYLKAVAALKSAADGKAVVAEMKKQPTDDPLFGKGTIRADGRKLHRPICSKSRSRRNPSIRATSTRPAPPSRPTRPSVRSRTAAVRW